MASPREGAMAGRNAGCSTPQIHGIDATVVPLWCPSCLLAFGNLQKENDAFSCMPQFAFFGTGHCYGNTLFNQVTWIAIRLPSLDGWRSNLKQKSCGLEKFERIRLQPPFLSLVTACDCFLLWGSRFSLAKAHHFKYPPSEAVWTISLKVRSLAG